MKEYRGYQYEVIGDGIALCRQRDGYAVIPEETLKLIIDELRKKKQ